MAEKQDLQIESAPLNASAAKDEDHPHEHAPEKSRIPAATKAWLLLFIHAGICVALALCVAFAINGYEAIDPSAPHQSHKGLVLSVSDITTLVSAALVIVKLFVSSWSTLMVWACGHFLLNKAKNSARPDQVSFMMRWKLPPWFLEPLKLSATSHNWVISVGLLLVLVQAFISPILSGSVNWKTSAVPSDNVTNVFSFDPTADFGGWYWYNAQGQFDKRSYLREAAGFASLVWADSSTVSANGSSLTGNGCRSVVNDNGLPVNSTLAGAIVPCIKVHSIDWYTSESDVSEVQSDLIATTAGSGNLSVVNDAPYTYYHPGASVVFDPQLLRTIQNGTVTPEPTLWLGNGPAGVKTIGLMMTRQTTTSPSCTNLNSTPFGDINTLGYYLLPGENTGNQNCYLVGTINFTAGVTTSKISNYIAPRVVEDQTPLDQVVFDPNPWVQEAIWLLPDLMTMISVMNSSQLPTYNNIDGYVEILLRQAYLSAWDMLHNSFDMTGPVYQAIPVEPRLKADVSFVRVYAWLALCLLMPASGVLLLTQVLKSDDLVMPKELNKENKEEAKDELLGLAKDEVLDIVKGVGKELATDLLKN